MLSTIDWGAIGELLWAAPLAGIAVAVTFSVLILGASRAGEARRDGQGSAAVGFTALAIAAAVAFAAVVIFALQVITTK